MARYFDTRLVWQSLFVSASIFAVYGFAPGGDDKDPRVQTRLYSQLDYADHALAVGNSNEAVAYAEMVLLRREITVFVDDANAPRQIKEDAARALRDAAVNWEDALNREIHFRFVPFRDADVIVNYADGVRFDGKDAAGTIRWTRQVMNLGSSQYRYEVRANVKLRTYTPQGSMMNYKQMLHTAGHELGHILGLEDSAKTGDLMGPLRLDKPVERATREEKSSLIALRTQATEILARIEGYEASDEQQDSEHITILVVSDPAALIEAKEYSSRISGNQRRAAFVRSSRGDRPSSPREKSISITGLAR